MDVSRTAVNQPAAASIILDLVVPCYNEEDALPETHRQLLTLLDEMCRSNRISSRSKIYYVDDGSQDSTWALISELCRSDARVAGIRLSRNFGHQSALLAGLFTATGDAVVTVDADLQDDISVIPEMVDHYVAGHEVVYGMRRRRRPTPPLSAIRRCCITLCCSV